MKLLLDAASARGARNARAGPTVQLLPVTEKPKVDSVMSGRRHFDTHPLVSQQLANELPSAGGGGDGVGGSGLDCRVQHSRECFH